MTHMFLGINPWGKLFSGLVHVFGHLQSEVFKDRDFEQLVVLYLFTWKENLMASCDLSQSQ